MSSLTQGERVRLIRKSSEVNLTLEKFGERIGLRKSSLSQIENNINSLTDSNIKAICREFRVNESWLRDGEGEPFKPFPEEDETAAYVSELLEDDNNPLYGLIVEIVKTYVELSPASQVVIKDFAKKLRENIKGKASASPSDSEDKRD
ncbi:helix-turn-helix domain-containing protein [Dorea formicigenerans]|uniref:helix-turn-helix domain-containing protein n=1 Tax=Dorea formicigenerans TaxID=39486 RepID=UPI001FA86BCE|nr:helix-turn-helix transcriptional regulator [Dorea formicigenerans]